MTNRDLIEKLKQFDPDDEVMILDTPIERGKHPDLVDYEIINVENAGRGKRVIDLVIVRVP